jgi:hypothetical protein
VFASIIGRGKKERAHHINRRDGILQQRNSTCHSPEAGEYGTFEKGDA